MAGGVGGCVCVCVILWSLEEIGIETGILKIRAYSRKGAAVIYAYVVLTN